MTGHETAALVAASGVLVGVVLLATRAVDAFLAYRRRRDAERAVDAFLAGYWRDVPDDRRGR